MHPQPFPPLPRLLIQMLLILTLAGLAACSPSPTPVAPTLQPSPETPPTPTASATPTAPPERSLVVCLGYEPRSLYLYSDSSAATWSVLESVYDGPIDRAGYDAQAVILEKLPSLEDGDALIRPVTVSLGDEVVDLDGSLVTLTKDVRVYPSGCSAPDCAVTYTGQGSLDMDQMVVRFKLLPELRWSDGQPLTATDSVYSFQLAAAPETPVSKYSVDRTVSYLALDELTVEWVGKPGYLNNRFQTYFWTPLPYHAWGALSPAELLQAEVSTTRPLGWGPYEITEWIKGDHLTLRKNPHYFRSKEGLPYFDHLVYRFLGENSSANLSALLAGECDVVDPTGLLDEQIERLVEIQKSQKLKAFFISGPEWEHLDFGIHPAAYDDGYNPASGDRADFFGDERTRQAFSQCLDRQKVVDQLFLGQSQVADSYLPAQHPLFNPDVQKYTYDPAAGSRLLEEIGWKDTDGSPATPRLAQGVRNVPDNTPLVVNYWTTEAALRKASSQILAESLRQCGIQVDLKHMNPGELFAPGPEGPIFGRAFDLVQYTWESSAQPPCFLYMSNRIPQASNQWVGVNVSGYTNQEYDTTCQAALSEGLLSAQENPENHHRAQEIFAEELPVVPLYLHLKAAASRPDLCNFALDPTVRSGMWKIEEIDYGGGCQNP